MGFLRELFGPSRAEVWSRLAQEIGARFQAGGYWGTDLVQAQVDDWILTLDCYTVSTGKSTITYTRMRAPFVNRDGLRFTIYRNGFFSEFGKMLGMQDVEVGLSPFDREFILQGNDESKIRALLANPRVPPLFQAQPAIHLSVVDDEGWFGPNYPEGVDQLQFVVGGVITDIERLKRLFDLFAEVLHQLAHMDSAYKDDEMLLIEALQGPGGQVKAGELVLWNGGPARWRAAEGLGQARSRRGVCPLLTALRDPDPLLRAHAAVSLGEIGDRQAIPSLVSALGDLGHADGRTVGDYAAEALRQLGEGALVDTYSRALEGDSALLKRMQEGEREPFIQAFLGTLESPDAETAARTARALAELGAVEALPRIRAQASRVRSANGEIRKMLDAAIQELERRKDLPRPTGAPEADPNALPRPASSPD